jgi:hypothetical protein
MKGPSPTPPRRSTSTVDSDRRAWDNPWLRGLVSLLVLGHLVAVAVAPFAILTAGFAPRLVTPGPAPPVSPQESLAEASRRREPVILRLAKAIGPYLDVLYLNHGYSFFAPEPSASYVIEYEIEKTDGQSVRGRLPDLSRHWPRLLYHRYFMLSSQNDGLMGRAEASGKVPPGSTNTLAHAIARHLNNTEGGQRTVLRLLVHRLLWPQDVLQGKPQDAADTYVVVGEIAYTPSSSGERLGAIHPGDTIAIAAEVRP